MAVYNAWTVEYKNGSTWTAISNVQDLSCSVGRQTAVDQWPVSQASIRIWFPTGYTTPIANLTIGTYIRFFAPGRSSTKPSWTGLVQNLTLEVGIPWNSATSTGNGDFLVIDCEGNLAVAQRANQLELDEDGGTITRFLTRGLNSNGVVYGFTFPGAANTDEFIFFDAPTGSSNPYNPGENIQSGAVVSHCRVCDGVKKQSGVNWSIVGAVDDPALVFGEPAGKCSIATVGFSDTANNSTNRIYDQIIFDGLADSYYTQAQFSADSTSGNRTFTRNSASSPIRTFFAQIPPASGLNNKTEWSLEWWANAFNPADIGVASISATTNGQHTQNLDTLGTTDLELGYLPLYVVPVTLRGTTFYCQIEGVQVTADTNQARFTYYVTPTDTTAWFTLDSSTFGVLDQNRLGIY